MTVAVKYCGGCNPRYERTELAERLRADFPGVRIVRAEEPADVAAIHLRVPGRVRVTRRAYRAAGRRRADEPRRLRQAPAPAARGAE